MIACLTTGRRIVVVLSTEAVAKRNRLCRVIKAKKVDKFLLLSREIIPKCDFREKTSIDANTNSHAKGGNLTLSHEREMAPVAWLIAVCRNKGIVLFKITSLCPDHTEFLRSAPLSLLATWRPSALYSTYESQEHEKLATLNNVVLDTIARDFTVSTKSPKA